MNKASFLIYFVVFLMFSTSSLYFLVAIFGENIENNEAHGLQLIEGQEEETTESGHNEEQGAAEIHNESGESPEQRLEEQEALKQTTNGAEHIEGELSKYPIGTIRV